MKKSLKKKLMWTGTALLAVLVLFAFGMFLRAAVVNARSKAAFQELSSLVVRDEAVPAVTVAAATPGPLPPVDVVIPLPPSGLMTEAAAASSTAPASGPGETPAPTPTPAPAPIETPAPAPTPLPDYAALYERNSDFFGWISVAGTNVDYPVMYNPQKPLQYLGHDFDGRFSYAGVPYLSPECDPEGSYFLIYGHHMRDGTMFAGLLAYEDPAFWTEHPTFRCDTRFEHRTYAVVAAFRARVLTTAERGFRYYNYSALDDERTFDEFMTNVRAMAAYDTGVETAFGDEILTLTTCAYHTEKGRFVVVAKRVS